jgi:hypothetical protein
MLRNMSEFDYGGLLDSGAVLMEAVCSSKTLVCGPTYKSRRRNNLDQHSHPDRCEILEYLVDVLTFASL